MAIQAARTHIELAAHEPRMVTDRKASCRHSIVGPDPVNELARLLPPEVVSCRRVYRLFVHLLILFQAAGDGVVLADGVVDGLELGHFV